MSLTVCKLTDDIILYHSMGQFEVSMAFMRLTEFYEGEAKHIKGKVFPSVEALMEAYAKHGSMDKTYTFFTDWSGFNVPGHVVKQFFKKHKRLNKYEKIIKDSLKDKLKSSKKFYIIGSKSTRQDVIDHEVAHGLYLTDDKYHKEVSKLLKKVPNGIKLKIKKWLIDVGYPANNPAIITDEIHAYLSTSSIQYLTKDMKLTGKELQYVVPLVNFVMDNVSKVTTKYYKQG